MNLIKRAIVSVSSTSLTDEEKYLLNKHNPLGVTLFLRNIETPHQLQSLVKEIKGTIGRGDVLICIDQEGGRVARLREPFFRSYLSQRAIGLFEEDEAKRVAFLQALLISDDLKKMGINLNYAPCIDLLHEKTGNVLKSRCLSDDPKKVTVLAEKMVKTYHQNGIIACLKHAPGHGQAMVDPHLALPIVDLDLNDFQPDLYPFKMLASESVSMMTAHILLPKVDSKPVTQSQKAISELIRGEIGFDGFLISDAIDMKALKGSLSEKVKSSLEAGCDAICYCMGQVEGLEEVLSTATYLTDENLNRFEKMKNILSLNDKPVVVDERMIDSYQNLFNLAPRIIEDYDAVEVLNQLKS
ncbi:MAG: beta-N-acetylhexosaminidase [Alphaproteobacteria bacterium]|nr:beta-N-acetylhexosaminidase [Alphaproteobacteria bacterium]